MIREIYVRPRILDLGTIDEATHIDNPSEQNLFFIDISHTDNL